MPTRTKRTSKIVTNVSTKILSARMKNLFLQNRPQNYHHLVTVFSENELNTFRNHYVVAKPNVSRTCSLCPTTERDHKEPAYV
jgi:hypothetical protein